MKYTAMSWETKRAQLREWHQWFAWKPVHVGHGYDCWLEWVWRKGEFIPRDIASHWRWEYKAIK